MGIENTFSHLALVYAVEPGELPIEFTLFVFLDEHSIPTSKLRRQ